MSETVGYVDATFGGSGLRFELDRKDIPGLEAMLQDSAYHVFTKFAAGSWTIRDLEAVLSASVAAQVEDPADRSARVTLYRMARQFGGSMLPMHSSPYVQGIIQKNPPARYAVLALKVLEAALFGIKSADAVFDENSIEDLA